MKTWCFSRITIPSLAGKTVKICTEIDGATAFEGLDCERERLLTVFRQVSANSFNLIGDSLEDIASTTDFGVSPEQALFALKVFEQLGLVSFKNGKIGVARGVKTQLSNSELYNFVNSLN